MITQLKSPLYAQLELTASCNNSCNYCYNFWRSAGVKGVAEEAHPFSHFSAIIDELARNDVFQLTITGGEPLLKKEILLKTIERASKLGIDVSLNTNLTLLDDVMAQCLKDMGLKSVLGSLISHDKNTYNQISGTKNYASVLEGMDAVVRAGISLGVNMVVEKQNLGYVFDTARLCSERGVGHFFATRLNPSPAKKEQIDLSLSRDETRISLDALLRARDAFDMKVDVLEPLPHCAFDEPQYLELLDRTCTAGLTWVAISPSGDVRPCTHFDTSYGNILKEGLKASWDSMGAWKSELMIPRECKEDCREYVYCGGGCRASALCTGDASNNDLLMTEAITEPRYHKPFVEVKYTADDTFVLNPRARYRNEGFGITVYVNPKLVCFLNEDAKKLLAALGNMKRFGVRDITNYVEGDPNGITKYLLGRGVLNKV